MHDEINLKDSINKEEGKLIVSKKQKEQKIHELIDIVSIRENNTIKIEQQKQITERLNNDNKKMQVRINLLQSQLETNRQQCLDITKYLESCDKELLDIGSATCSSKRKNYEAEQEIQRLKRDNEVLGRILDKYKDDIDFQVRETAKEIDRKKQLKHERMCKTDGRPPGSHFNNCSPPGLCHLLLLLFLQPEGRRDEERDEGEK